MTSWPNRLVIKKAIECGCTILPRRQESHKLQTCWEGPYNIIIRMNDVIYRIQRHPKAKMTVVHLDRLAPYLGATRDE